jgi:hypothetical protein
MLEILPTSAIYSYNAQEQERRGEVFGRQELKVLPTAQCLLYPNQTIGCK